MFVIEEADLGQLETISKRLFTEERMNGDKMRDFAQVLALIVRRCKELELPEDEP
jgi:hypothetical protein